MPLQRLVLLIVALCATARFAAAQSFADRQVSASGTSSITALPELLRVSVVIKGDGKEVKEALAKLASEKQSAKDKLLKLGVAADAIKFADPAMGEKPLTPQQRQIRMMMNMRNQGGKKPATAPSTVSVTTTLSADVALKAASADEMLIAAADLQEKLRTAFKGSAKAPTPEEQEVLEEMQGAEEAAGGGAEARPGEPAFLFVHVVTEAEQNKALADAFAQARRSAERLAKAAGSDLGDLKTLSATSSTAGDNNDAQSIFYAAMMAGRTPSNEPAVIEATSPQPGPVSSRLAVNATFGLK
jgi:uncharacterized protein YggE